MINKNGFLKHALFLALIIMLGGVAAGTLPVKVQAAENTISIKRTGFVKINGYWYFYNKYGKKVTGWLTTKSGNRYYFGKDGAAKAGIRTIGGKKYCFTAKGKMLTGWQTLKGKTYYFDMTAGYMRTGWMITSSGKRYYFWSDGIIRSGWHKLGNKYYYFGKKGLTAVNRFITTNNRTYYVDSTGARKTGIAKIKGYWYAFHPVTGVLYRSSFYKDKNGYYYLAAANGRLCTGFQTVNSKVRYFDPSTCRMATGWKTINGAKYYFNTKNGSRYENCRLKKNGKLYFFMSNGKLYIGRWFTRNGRYFYAQSDGALAVGWLTYENNKYYMNLKSGARSSGWLTISGKKYYFSPSTGIMARDTWVDSTHFVGEDGALISGMVSPSFRWPLHSSWNYISSYFGTRESPGGIGSTNHRGIDISANMNTPIYAAADGVIKAMIPTAQSGGAGNYTIIDHGNGFETEYMHQNKFVTSLKVGDKVTKGQRIGYVGSTGNSTGPHLHFGVIVNGVRENPLNFVKQPG